MGNIHLIEMPTWECLQLLERSTIGRLAVMESGYPVALPISYQLAKRPDASIPLVVVRTRAGGVVERALGRAALEVDEIDVERRRAWSVIVRGMLRPIDDTAGLPPPQPWLSDDRHRWLALEPHVVTGRRFVGVEGQTFSVEWEYAQR